jgi:hypothetical protein
MHPGESRSEFGHATTRLSTNTSYSPKRASEANLQSGHSMNTNEFNEQPERATRHLGRKERYWVPPTNNLKKLLSDAGLRQRVFAREHMARWFLEHQSKHPWTPVSVIEELACRKFRGLFQISKRSLHRWVSRYKRFGLAGVMEYKKGRVGRSRKLAANNSA